MDNQHNDLFLSIVNQEVTHETLDPDHPHLPGHRSHRLFCTRHAFQYQCRRAGSAGHGIHPGIALLPDHPERGLEFLSRLAFI